MKKTRNLDYPSGSPATRVWLDGVTPFHSKSAVVQPREGKPGNNAGLPVVKSMDDGDEDPD